MCILMKKPFNREPINMQMNTITLSEGILILASVMIFPLRPVSGDFTGLCTAGHISIHGLPICSGTLTIPFILE